MEVVRRQYAHTDPLQVRIATHRQFSERFFDFDEVSVRLMCLDGGERIVDVGCGPGHFLGFLYQCGHRGALVGVDQSTAMVGEASERWRARGLGNWVRGSATTLPLADHCADWVTARHMLYHVVDRGAALREFCRIVAAEGQLLLSTNSEHGLVGIHDLISQLADAFGFASPERFVRSFTLENALPQLLPYCAAIEVVLLPDALVFQAVEPIVAYVCSLFPSWQGTDNGDLAREMRAWLEERTTKRFQALGGVWRDEKLTGFFVCQPRGERGGDCVIREHTW